jgi:hypothetical protein
MVLWVWVIIAAVLLGIGTLLGLADRRARRKGHVIRRASTMSAIASSRRTSVRRRRPRVSPTPPQPRSKYPKL